MTVLGIEIDALMNIKAHFEGEGDKVIAVRNLQRKDNIWEAEVCVSHSDYPLPTEYLVQFEFTWSPVHIVETW